MIRTALATATLLLVTAGTASARPHAHVLLDGSEVAKSVGITTTLESPTKAPAPFATYADTGVDSAQISAVSLNGRVRVYTNVGAPDSPNSIGYIVAAGDTRSGGLVPVGGLGPAPLGGLFGASVIRAQGRYVLAWWQRDAAQPRDLSLSGDWIATSLDGEHWTPVATHPVLTGVGDISWLWYDSWRHRYVMYVRSTLDVYPRTVSQAFSTDLVHWSTPSVVIAPDDLDTPDTQYYDLGGIVQRGPLLIGTLRVLNGYGEAKVEPGYTQLAYSRDGVTWQRYRTPFLDRGPDGMFDHGETWADAQVDVGDHTFIYYAAFDQGHKIDVYGGRSLGVASMLRDRYVAWTAESGTITTRPLALGRRLTVNADVRGSLTFDVVRRGRRVATCSVRGNGVALVPRCPGKMAGGPTVLRFHLQDVDLYAFTG